MSFLRASPPPPHVVLLSDPLFFSRAVPVSAGASGAEAALQIELALESISPFPLAQLYYGWFWAAGAEGALVFAAYRRRFTNEQTAGWTEAELVMPSFAALLGAEGIAPATAIILHAPEAVTVVYWAKPAVPAKVLSRVIELETSDADRAKVRDALVSELGGSLKVVELSAPPVADPATSDGEVVLRSGEFVSRLSVGRFAALDVRDKADLTAMRNARRRDVVLWRTALACVAALALLGVGELGLVGGRIWQEGAVGQGACAETYGRQDHEFPVARESHRRTLYEAVVAVRDDQCAFRGKAEAGRDHLYQGYYAAPDRNLYAYH